METRKRRPVLTRPEQAAPGWLTAHLRESGALGVDEVTAVTAQVERRLPLVEVDARLILMGNLGGMGFQYANGVGV